MFNFAKNILKINNEFEILFYIKYDIYIEYRNDLIKNNFVIINEVDLVSKNKLSKIDEFKNTYLLSIKSKILKLLKFFNFTNLFTYKLKKKEEIIYKDLLINYQHLHELVKNHIFKIFLLEGDRNAGPECVFLKLAKDLNCKVIIPYFAYFAEQEDLLKLSKTNKKIKYFACNYVKRSQVIHKNHLRNNNYYYPHTTSNAQDRLGVLPDNPWFMGGGHSDILCLPNAHMRDHYVRNGIDTRKIKIIGDIAYDELFNSFNKQDVLRNYLIKKYGLNKEKEIIIVALPQLGEHKILSWSKHWDDIRYLVESLDSLNVNCLLSLHPKMNINKYRFLQNEYGCNIINEKLVHVLPVADMFVASFSSSVFWSVLCGIKTIVIDFYGFNLKIFDFLETIQKVSNRYDFVKTLKTINNRKFDFNKDWTALSKSKVFDGNTVHRYVSLFRSLS